MHRGYIGLQQHAYLAGYAAGELQAATEAGIEISIPADGMFYVSAFQSGIDHFICHSVHKGAEPLSFLEKRISSPRKDVDAQIVSMVTDAFEALRRPAIDGENLVRISGFLSSLLGAMHHNAAMLNVMPVPEPAEITEKLAPELAAPLIQLIAQLRPFAESVPVPIFSIDRSNVTRFHTLLESDTFATYSDSHVELADGRKDSIASLANIRKSGRNLIEKGKNLLTARPSVIHVLNIMPKIVDTVLGKLPGALAQFAANVAQDRLSDRNQIVIYQLDQWMRNLTLMRLKSN